MFAHDVGEIMGDLKITCIKSNIEVCKLKKYNIVKNLSVPTEFWHCEAIYVLGTKLNKINTQIYNNSSPHGHVVS